MAHFEANLLQRSLPWETVAAPITRAQINVLPPYIPLLFMFHLPPFPSLPYQREEGRRRWEEAERSLVVRPPMSEDYMKETSIKSNTDRCHKEQWSLARPHIFRQVLVSLRPRETPPPPPLEWRAPPLSTSSTAIQIKKPNTPLPCCWWTQRYELKG